MILLIDNYDSFTYNLYDYLSQLHEEVMVYRNDAITIEKATTLCPSAIVISPGPETPSQAGITLPIIAHFHQAIPILGICLGFQAIGQFFGAQLVRCPYPMHGKTSLVYHTGNALFAHISNPFPAMRYHSLCLKNINSQVFDIIAQTADDIPMAIRHRQYPLVGLQFHPESVLTPDGMQCLVNWKKNYLA